MCHMIPISFVPPDPDHSGVFWTEKPHPLPEVIMSKETGMPLAVGPSSPPSDGGNPNTTPPVSSTSVSPWSITGSSRLKGNDSTGSTGTTVPTPPHRTEAIIADLVLTVRAELEQVSDLGFHGAEVIHEALKSRKIEPLPSVRTINRILERRGVLDGQKRIRRPAPPPGWHLPEVASKRRELDSFDVVEGLVIKGGPQVEVLNGISLHGGLAASWPVEASVTAKLVVESLIEHWRASGLPGYAQFDNDTIFQGTHPTPT